MSEQEPNFPEIEQKIYTNGAVHLYGVDEAGKKHHVAEHDVLESYGYQPGADGKYEPIPGDDVVDVVTPTDPTPETPTYADNLNKLGEAMNKAGKEVGDDRMLDAYMAADDYAEGHDRLDDNAHTQHLDGAAKKLFALASQEKQSHADRVVEDGAYDRRLKKITTGVRSKIDDEIDERKNDSYAFWSGEEEPTGPKDGGDIPKDDQRENPELKSTPEGADANEKLKRARANLARVRAGREARTAHRRGGKFGNKALNQAINDHNQAENEAGLIGMDMLEAAGYNRDEIDKLINWSVTIEAFQLTADQYNNEIRQSGDKRLNKFYSFWARHSQAKLFSAQGIKNTAMKAGVMAPVGIGMGVLLAPVAAGAGAAAGGAFLASRISRGIMGAKMSKEANAATLAGQKADARIAKIASVSHSVNAELNAGNQGTSVDKEAMGDMYYEDTNEVVKQSRKRAAKSAGTAAIIGTAASVGLELIDSELGFHSSSGGGNTPEDTGSGGGNTPEHPGGGNTDPDTGNGGNTPEAPEADPFEDFTPEQLDAFKRYVEWSDNFKAENPILNTPSGVDVSAGTEAYWNEMQRLWTVKFGQ